MCTSCNMTLEQLERWLTENNQDDLLEYLVSFELAEEEVENINLFFSTDLNTIDVYEIQIWTEKVIYITISTNYEMVFEEVMRHPNKELPKWEDCILDES